MAAVTVAHGSLHVEVLDSVEAEWWNSLVASDPGGTIFQNSEVFKCSESIW